MKPTIFILMLSSLLLAGTTYGATIDDLVGTWYADDEETIITTLDVFPDTTSDFAIGSVLVDGECWQCGNEQASNLFALPLDDFAVLPVAEVDGVAESLLLTWNEDDTLTATLTYRVPPAVCNPPFHCRWEVVDEIEVLLTR